MDDRSPTGTPPRRPAEAATLAGVWEQFYAHCFAIINQCAGVRRLSGADREDCVQDVMMELVRRFGDRPEAALRGDLNGWIRVLSRNKAADIARRKTRKPEVGFDDGSGEKVLDAGPAEGAAGPGGGEYVSLVWEALLSLDHEVPVTSYLVFYLRTIEGWTVGELAELFGITPEQARARCHRVRKKFGEILKAGGPRRGRSRPA